MIAPIAPRAPVFEAVVSDQYVVAFGNSGGLGCFTVLDPLELSRGDRVVVKTPRGLELGEVLGPATLRQARLIGALTAGEIVRPATAEDQNARRHLRRQADQLFEAAQTIAIRLDLPVQILDVEILLDGLHALVQFVGGAEAQLLQLAETLRPLGSWEIRFENLAAAASPAEDEDAEHGGCGKPDCGKVEGGSGGGCSTCSTGGGCSSCGAGKPDLRPYFAHLRDKMETSHRTPLL